MGFRHRWWEPNGWAAEEIVAEKIAALGNGGSMPDPSKPGGVSYWPIVRELRTLTDPIRERLFRAEQERDSLMEVVALLLERIRNS